MGILILLMIIVHTGRNNLSIGLIIYALYKIVKDKLEGVTMKRIKRFIACSTMVLLLCGCVKG